MKGALRATYDARLKPRAFGAFVPLLCSLAACQEQIVHDLSEREANSVVSQLSMARLDARKVQQPDGRWAISVDQDEMLQALSYIETRRVLTSRDAKSVSNKGVMIPSREEQWFRYERSVAVSIEESLSALPGVLDARVHVNLPDDDPLFGDSARKGGSGSVLLVVDKSFTAADAEVGALVGGAAGLPRDAVRVLRSEAVEANPPAVVEVSGDIVPPPPESTTESRGVGFFERALFVSLLREPWVGAASLVVSIGAACGVWLLRRRPKRTARFELPKELDFEG